jgi:hypothetical protein
MAWMARDDEPPTGFLSVVLAAIAGVHPRYPLSRFYDPDAAPAALFAGARATIALTPSLVFRA